MMFLLITRVVLAVLLLSVCWVVGGCKAVELRFPVTGEIDSEDSVGKSGIQSEDFEIVEFRLEDDDDGVVVVVRKVVKAGAEFLVPSSSTSPSSSRRSSSLSLS